MDKEKDGLIARFTKYFYIRWRLAILIWVFILGFGVLTYTNLIKREGFPPIQFPIAFVSGVYVDQPSDIVDKKVTKLISDAINALDQVTSVKSSATDGFFTVVITFKDSESSESGTELIRNTINNNVDLPSSGIQLSYTPIDPGSLLQKYDLIVQVFSTDQSTDSEIDAASTYVASVLAQLPEVNAAEPKLNLTNVQDIKTDSNRKVKNSFSRYGYKGADDSINFHESGVIGVSKYESGDVIALSDAVNLALEDIDLSQFGEGYKTVVSADFAQGITSQIDFLGSNMLTGLLAVAIVSFLLITWRASLITAMFMITVMISTIIVLYLIGYTLNVITLFALILSLGLFVDDATIVVEAIDANKRDKKLSNLQVISRSINKVGMASLAGTLTTVLVFAILATPTGILGEFIRLIPITVIIALILSFLLSISLIPLLSRFLILRDRKDSWITEINPVIKFEGWASRAMESNILSIRSKKGRLIGITAIIISMLSVVSGVYVFGFKVDQNTFPPPKDADQIGLSILFKPNTTISQAEATAKQVEDVAINSVGTNVVSAYYGSEFLPNTRQAELVIDLVPFTDRNDSAPQIVQELKNSLQKANTNALSVSVSSIDNGPPSSQFPFGVRVYSDDLKILDTATQKIAQELTGVELENFNGEKIKVLKDQISGVKGEILRDGGRQYAITKFAFDSDNPTIVSLLTEKEFKKLFTDNELSKLSISMDNIEFDSGQEGDFQDSFATLVIAVPIAIILMYVLLAIQFRSLMQPLLILLAIPFTLFGVGVGLFATSNSASFFVLVGFIGLIGIAVNNTIMLTDYANQQRRLGMGPVASIASATRQRLRPLIATTLTTVVALLPLALSDPFWEALSFTIIFGLISSTILVLLSFPYYYLGEEWLRLKIRSKIKKA